MFSNSTIHPHPLPSGTNSLALIRPCLQALMIGHTFLVLLIPLLVALFYYSTPYSRRKPIFILNVLAIILAFAAGVVADAFNIHLILSPQNTWSARIQIAIGFIGSFQSMLVDVILLVRLITVHPLSHIGFMRFARLTSLPIILKVARLVNVILYISKLSHMATGPDALEKVSSAWLTLPYMKIEWIAQVVDNSYASIAFIWTIRNFKTDTMPNGLTSITIRRSSFAERIQILSNFALSNFIIPTLISIVQVVLIFRTGTSNPFVLNDIALVNARISVFGVVFATVWAGKAHRQDLEAKEFQNPLSMELEQRRTHGLDGWMVGSHPPVTLANIEHSHSDNMSSISEKDPGNQDDDIVEERDVALLPEHMKGNGSACQDLRTSEPYV